MRISSIKWLSFLVIKIVTFWTYFHMSDIIYELFHIFLLITCTFAYTPVFFSVEDVAENLKKSGACIPGVSPGDRTAKYFARIIDNLMVFASLYLCFICIIPIICEKLLGISLNVSGTSLLIATTYAIELYSSIVSYFVQNYGPYIKKQGINFPVKNKDLI
jgi:preprotein translocase subunit SecY